MKIHMRGGSSWLKIQYVFVAMTYCTKRNMVRKNELTKIQLCMGFIMLYFQMVCLWNVKICVYFVDCQGHPVWPRAARQIWSLAEQRYWYQLWEVVWHEATHDHCKYPNVMYQYFFILDFISFLYNILLSGVLRLYTGLPQTQRTGWWRLAVPRYPIQSLVAVGALSRASCMAGGWIMSTYPCPKETGNVTHQMLSGSSGIMRFR